jgi:hypothetical protein
MNDDLVFYCKGEDESDEYAEWQDKCFNVYAAVRRPHTRDASRVIFNQV